MTSTGVDETRAPATASEPIDAVVLHAVADPTRWAVLQQLATAELCTTHLQELLDTKQAVMSHHLKVLRDAGLVLTAPCGRFTYYRLRPGTLDNLAAAVTTLAAASHEALERKPC